MEKVKGFFRNFNEKRSYQIVFFVVSMCVILGGYFVLRAKVAEEVSHRYTVVEDDSLIKFVEAVSMEDGLLTISGWCFYKGANSNENTIQIFLRNVKREEDTIWLDVKRIERTDVGTYYKEYDCLNSGFCASTKLNNVKVDDSYEICIKLTGLWIDGKEFVKTVSTHSYIVNGMFSRIEPERKMEFCFAEEIQQIIDGGEAIAYIEEADIYIYQKNSVLCWIAGPNFQFDSSGLTYIVFRVNSLYRDVSTHNTSKNKEGIENLDFYFESGTVYQDESCRYKAVIKYLPTDASITGFLAGQYDHPVWEWKRFINVDIR